MFSDRVFRGIRCVQSTLSQIKRSAGHSKWQNIRHGKAVKDGERSLFIIRKLRDIRVVLAGNGWVTDPAQSAPLARVIDSALRGNIPKETLDTYLKKMDKAQEIPVVYRLRGPHDSIFNITFSCTLPTRNDLCYNVKKLLQKSSLLQVTTGFQQAFETKGIILAKHLEKEASMDDAEEAAILAGAEEVRPEEDGNDHIYRFLTESGSAGQVARDLKEIKWNVMSTSLEDLPTYLVDIPEAELEQLVEEIGKFQELPEFLKMVDNVKY